MRYARAGVVGRFKPLHLGGTAMLDAICDNAEHVIIGIGSAGTDYKYNVRNPLTPQETREMLEAYLSPRHSNYEIIEIPDFAHIPGNEDGQAWREHVKQAYGDLDVFVTGNDFVQHLLKDDYAILHPSGLIPRERRIMVRGTQVRILMAQDGPWDRLVPAEVAQYIRGHRLDGRFRREFGLQALAELSDDRYLRADTADEEHRNAMEGNAEGAWTSGTTASSNR